MNLYPNYYSLNNFFIDNFNDYTKFINDLNRLTFDDNVIVYDKIHNKYTDLNDNYNSKIFLKIENFIVDSYLNIFIISENKLYIQNYIQFPPYILYLIRDKIMNVPTIDDIGYAKELLKLTKYVIIHNNHDEECVDIEDSIYLRNQINQYKLKLNETEYIITKKDDRINELNKLITELKLKLRKANFSLMENQNIFAEIHVDITERDLELDEQKKIIDKQEQLIKKQEEEIKKQEEEIKYYESTFIYKIYTIYEGLYIYFSRIRF